MSQRLIKDLVMRRKRFARDHRRSNIMANIGPVTVSVFLFTSLLFGCNTTRELSPASQEISQDNTDKVTTQINPEADERKEIQPVDKKETLGQTEEIWREPITGMEFIRVPGGCYEMGCGSWAGDCDNDSKPAHEVCVDGFWIARYEVTLDQWMKIIKFNRPEIGKAPNHPVENISWYDAKEFIELLNATSNDGIIYRLPTEVEWEYASRSGGKSEVYAGSNEIEAVAWYRENSDKHTHRVGSKGPNGLGIYDMSGNVREWCEDRYSGNAYRRHQQNNPIYQAGGSFRVIRGGGYKTVAFFCRSTSRYRLNPHDRHSGVGFRIIRTSAKEMSLDSTKKQIQKIGKETSLDSTKNQIQKIGTVKVILGNIRKGPSKKYKIIATVKKGDKVTIIRRKNKWYYVRLAHGRLGWCHLSLLLISHE
jgi:formylglycine-generating enzyme required for sulfatase activity